MLDGPAKDTGKLLPLRALLTRPVVVSVANYCMIGLLDIMGAALIPLVWSTSVEFGGLGMSPASIGLWLAGCGLLSGIFQFVAFPRLVGRFGPRRVFIAGTLCFFPIYTLLPFENLALRNHMKLTVELLIALQLMMVCLSGMGLGRLPRPYNLSFSLKWCGGSNRCDIYVHILSCAQQAITRRYEWNCADNDRDSAHDRTSCCRVFVCILLGQWHPGRQLCICRGTRHCVGWAGRHDAASREYVET